MALDSILRRHGESRLQRLLAAPYPAIAGLLYQARQRLRESDTLHRANDVRGRLLNVYGHPSAQKQGDWAFQHERGEDVFSQQVPENLDILITHSPPPFHLDLTGQGDPYFLHELWRTKPRLHVFGHIHAGHGEDVLVNDRFSDLYEKTCAGEATLVSLDTMVPLLAWMYVVEVDRGFPITTLVNAAIVGGIRNDVQHQARTVKM